MMTDYSVNLNQAECLKSMSHFGYERIHNVCNGTFVDVQWGIGEWGINAIMAILLVVVVVVAVGMVRLLWTDL
jgi:hypothetical protein